MYFAIYFFKKRCCYMISIYIIRSSVFEFDNKQKRFGYTGTCNKLDIKCTLFIISVGYLLLNMSSLTSVGF